MVPVRHRWSGGAIIQVTIVVMTTRGLGQSQRRMSTSTPLRTGWPASEPTSTLDMGHAGLRIMPRCASTPCRGFQLGADAQGAIGLSGWVELSDGIGAGSVEVGYAGVSFMPW